jgi:hypothetical protein
MPHSAKCSTTAVETAVPKLCPCMTMLRVGTFATFVAHSTAAMPSLIKPSSVGVPVEWPKPR